MKTRLLLVVIVSIIMANLAILAVFQGGANALRTYSDEAHNDFDEVLSNSPLGGSISLSPFTINGNEELQSMASTHNWSGDGSASHPFIIRDYYIDAAGTTNCILIQNIDLHFTIRNCTLEVNSNYAGVWLVNVTNGIIEANQIINSGRAVHLQYVTGIIIRDNNITTYHNGILIRESSHNIIINNTITAIRSSFCNVQYGVQFEYKALNNELYSNRMYRCGVEFFAEREALSAQVIPSNNTVNDRPLRFFANQDLGGMIITEPSGQVVLAESNNLVIKNQNLSMGSCSVQMGYCSNIVMDGCNLSSGIRGVNMDYCDGISILNCNISTTELEAVVALYCSNVLVEECTISQYDDSHPNSMGINCLSGSYWKIINCTCKGLTKAIHLTASYSEIRGNTISMSSGHWSEAVAIHTSYVTVSDNVIFQNDENGLYGEMSNCMITYNIFLGNSGFGIKLLNGNGNQIYGNQFINNNGAGTIFSSSHVQASDTTGSQWHSGQGWGNYWEDWTSPDDDHDFIVDSPYPVAGGSTTDPYPVVGVTSPPRNLTGEILVDGIRLSWQEPSFSISSEVDGYKILRSNSSGPFQPLAILDDVQHYVDHDVSWGVEYAYLVKAITGINEGAASEELNITYEDLFEPSVTIHSPPSNSMYNITSVDIEWNATDIGLGIDHYEYRLDNGTWVDLGSNTTLSLSAISEGWHNFEVLAVDLNGNEGNDSLDFLIDLSDPEVHIIDPEWLDFVNSQFVEISWQSHDNLSGVKGNYISVDGGEWIDLGSQSTYTTPALADGDHQATVLVTDQVGHICTNTTIFHIDTVDPELEILEPTSGIVTNCSSILVRWNGSDSDSGLSGFLVKSGSSWIDFGLETSAQVQLSEGYNLIQVQAVDRAGNSKIVSVEVFLDSTIDTLYFITPSEGEILNESSLDVKWTGTDYSGIVEYQYRLDGNSWISMGLSTETSLEPLSDGIHTLDLRAFDALGNCRTITIDFTVDTVSPEISIEFPFQNGLYNQSQITVEWVGTDSCTSIDEYEIFIDGNFTLTLGGNQTDIIIELDDGAHNIQVIARDAAGNQASDRVDIIIDTSPPIVSILYPASDSFINASEIVIQWEAINSYDLIGFEIRFDGSAWNGVAFNDSIVLHLSDGDHFFEVRAWDLAGNWNIDSTSFFIDTVPPSVNQINLNITNSNNVTLEWNSSDGGSGIDYYQVRLNNGSWEVIGIDCVEYGVLPDGSYCFEICAVDKAGNNGNVSAITWDIDTSPPTVISYGPTGGDVCINATIFLELSEPVLPESLQILVGSLQGNITLEGNMITFKPSTNLERATDYIVWVNCSDFEGNWIEPFEWDFTTTISGVVMGIVLDENGDPMLSAIVSIDGSICMTDQNGSFLMELEPGIHLLTILMPGYEEMTLNFTLEEGETVTLNPISLSKETDWSLDPIFIIASLIIIVFIVSFVFWRLKS